MRVRTTSGWRRVQGLWRDLIARRDAPRGLRAAAAPAPSQGGAQGGAEDSGDRLQLTQTAIRMADRDAVERHLPDILEIIERADTPVDVRERATAIFRRLAEAEAAVHGIPVDKVHFH